MKKPKRGSKSSTNKSRAVRLPVRGSRKSSQREKAGKAGKTGKTTDKGQRSGGVTGLRARAATEPSRPPRDDVAHTRSLAVAAMEAALDKKALSPVLIDVSGLASYTDFIGVVSGRSDRQVDAIADSICQAMKSRGRYILGQEGTGSGRWTLLDFGSFVIHVFYHPVREFYDLESLWIEAPRVKLDVPPDATLAQADALYGAL